MNYVLLTISIISILAASIMGYFIGRYQTKLLKQIRDLQERPTEPVPPKPEKPVVTGGAYQPPQPISSATDNKKSAGLVETKTPERLEWEADNELAKLEHGA